MNITEIIVLITPYAITALTVLGFFIKVISALRSIRKDQVNINSVTDENSMLREELRVTNKRINELLTKIDRIERKD